ncbi:MAG: hypothetical protein F2667_04145 [Actinobacteria bacterium]|uniref:Unannotated protein n=1 Tax=freshwater metagenome TaxID=449393 RepID=A0A6J6PIA7_9ZZZZ|nr:hypothetical protein [Actinomycetota bacterium]
MSRRPALPRLARVLAATTALVLTAGLTAGLTEATSALPATEVSTAPASDSHQVRGDLGAATGAPKVWARRVLEAYADRLGVDADSVRWELVRDSLIGTSVRGRSYRGGVPVLGTDVLVAAIHGRVALIEARGTTLPGSSTVTPIGTAAARDIALSALDVTSLLVPATVERVLVPAAGRLVDTYRVSLVGKVPARAALVDIDAATGLVRGVTDPGQYDETGTVEAQIFDPNPIQSGRDTSLRSPFETNTGVDVPLDSAELTAQLQTRTLQHLDTDMLAAGVLKGTWVDVVAPVGYLNPLGGPLSYSRSDPRFVGVMAYAHLDRYQSWLQLLRITDVNAEAQQVIPTLLEGYDNSMYIPAQDLVVFGGGGVPDAEDAEVILHEYGHAMQDAQVPGYGESAEGGAMGEGFGDFNAANYFALTSKGFGDLCVADWDATSYSTEDPPCLRRMDSPKKYPADIEGEVHADGELWSAYLWRVRSHLGSTNQARTNNAITLVLAMHELLTPQAEFVDAVAGLRTAAKALGHRDWARAVVKEAKVTGFAIKR